MKHSSILILLLYISVVCFYIYVSNVGCLSFIEDFSNKNLSDFREDSTKIIKYLDKNDNVYTRLFELSLHDPSVYRHDIIKIKDYSNLNDDSLVLDAGCGTGRHMEIVREFFPKISIEGVDISKSMIKRAMVRNPGAEFLCTSLIIPEIYKPNVLSHILCLHETIHHNNPNNIIFILRNFHKWLKDDGHLIIHLLDPSKLDPGPRSFSQYYKAEDGTRHSLTYFEAFTHDAWWEKEEGKQNWYYYCEKFLFSKDRVKIHKTSLWIPPINTMIQFITRHNFKLLEILNLNDVKIDDFQLYILQKK